MQAARRSPYLNLIGSGSRAVSYLLGTFVIGLAIAGEMTSLDLAEIMAWAEDVFGITFLLLMTCLTFAALYAWVRMCEQQVQNKVWLEAGLQAANGVSILALTYTLLGISLGIGGLANQELTPETVQVVIRGLTTKFSLAFLTTVIGLPLSAVLRTLLLVTHARRQDAVETALRA